MAEDRAAQLQLDIDRIAARLGARTLRVNQLKRDNDLNISVDADGRYHYSYWERGKANFDRISDDIDDVVYWFAEGITAEIGSRYSVGRADANGDQRGAMWAKQFELLNALDPRWARRQVQEMADQLRRVGFADDVRLLPDIPERGPLPDPDTRQT
jgi:hypothetical protein